MLTLLTFLLLFPLHPGGGGGGGHPHSNYTGMCRRTGSCFGDTDLEQVTLQMHESFKITLVILSIEWGISSVANPF